jgi:hypothetical protein
MFCGWRLINSKPEIVKLGSGTVRVDALTGESWFGDQPAPLAIARELKGWLASELEANGIPINQIRRAEVRAELDLSVVPWEEPSSGEKFFISGRPVRAETMNRCRIVCSSEVATDELVYQASHQESEQWPVGWPAA